MNAFSNMYPLEQLYAFMDGELDPVFEKQLFGELSVNEELRSEMKDLLAMRDAMRRDIVAPSPVVRERLLASAGFVGGGAAGAATAARNFISSWITPILGAAFGAGVATIAMLLYQPAAPVARTNTSAMLLAASMDAPSLTLRMSSESKDNSGVSFKNINHFYDSGARRGKSLASTRDIALDATERNSDPIVNLLNKDNQGAEAQEPVLAESSAEDITNTNTLASKIINKSSANLSATAAEQPKIEIDDSKQYFNFRARGLFNQSFPISNIKEQSNSWINNAAFGAIYHFNSDLAAGVEIGMERFAQVFGGAEGASEVWYEQNPQMLWAGALVQYRLLELGKEMDTHLYGETLAGAAGTLGFLGRQTFGINLTPTPSLTLSAGVEAAVLPYVFKGAWFSTEKFGFTLGLSFTPEGFR